MLVSFLLIAAVRSFYDNEFQCLVSLYEMTNGPDWFFNDNWTLDPNSDANPCTFYGVKCSEDEHVVDLSLAGNNLLGSLPECLSELIFTSVDLSCNHLSGPMPALDPTRLQTLFYRSSGLTSLPSTLIDMHSLKHIRTSETAFTHAYPSPYFLDMELTYVDIRDCGIGFLKGFNLTLTHMNNMSRFIVGGNALSLNVLFSGASADKSSSYYLDLSGTNSSSLTPLNIAEFLKSTTAEDISLQHNRFTGTFNPAAIPPLQSRTIRSLDLSHNFLEGSLDYQSMESMLSNLSPEFYILSVGNNNLTMSTITKEEYLKLIDDHNFAILDLGFNPFICPDSSLLDSTSSLAYNCTALRPVAISHKDEVISIEMQTDTSFDADLLLRSVAVSLAYDAQTVVELVPLVILTAGENRFMASYKVPHTPEAKQLIRLLAQRRQSLHTDMVSFSVHGVKVSTRDSFFVAPQPNAGHTFSPKAKPIDNANDKRVPVSLFGLSRCPDFVDIVKTLMAQLIKVYPTITSLADIRFESLSSPNTRYISGVQSLHGQVEGLGEKGLLCIQKELGWEYERLQEVMADCIYQDDGINYPYNIEACIEKYFSPEHSYYLHECMTGDAAIELITDSWNKARNVSASWSPTLYIGNRAVCYWGMECRTSSAKELAEAICKEYIISFDRTPELCKNL